MDKKIESLIAEVRKKYGVESITTLSDNEKIDIITTPSGSLLLDEILGGGYPNGRIIEIYGPESSGKTTLALHAIAEVQKIGKTALFIDAEHALDPNYAARLGVKIDELVLSQPNFGEEGLDIAEAAIKTGHVGILVIDSVAALVPKQELDGEMGAQHVGLQARMMSQALRKIGAIANQTQTTVIFINQLREKVGVFFGNPEITPGGRALKFYSSIRLEVRRKEIIKVQDQIVGTRIKAKVVKNKIAPPFREAELEIYYSQGINRQNEVFQVGLTKNLIKRSGPWYFYKDEKISQGSEKAKVWLSENENVVEEILNYEEKTVN